MDLLTSPELGVIDQETKRLVPFQEDNEGLGGFSLGRNKIFLRHPQALSALEVLREERIPQMVNVIENAWRRFNNRIALTKFIAAEKEVNSAYRAISTNCQDRRMRRPGSSSKELVANLYATWNAVSAKLLKPDNGWSRKLAEDEKANTIIFAQSFVRAKQQRKEFLQLKYAQMVFSKRFRGLKTRKQMAVSMWQSCKVALLGVRTEFERYLGQKKRRRNTLDRQYQADYIGVNRYKEYAKILHSNKEQRLLFCGHVLKVNERFVHQDRVLMIGEDRLFNLKADKVDKPKERRVIELSKISGITMSTQPDNYVLIQIKGDADLFLQAEQKTEIVQALRNRFKRGYNRELRVTFADSFEFHAVKGKELTAKFSFDRSLKDSQWVKVDKRTMAVTVGVI